MAGSTRIGPRTHCTLQQRGLQLAMSERGRRRASDRAATVLAGPDANYILDRRDVDLAVADLSRPGSLGDRIDDRLDAVLGRQNRHLHLGKEVDGVLRAPVELGVPLLAAEALHLAHGDA